MLQQLFKRLRVKANLIQIFGTKQPSGCGQEDGLDTGEEKPGKAHNEGRWRPKKLDYWVQLELEARRVARWTVGFGPDVTGPV